MINYPDINSVDGKTAIYLVVYDPYDEQNIFVDSNCYLMMSGILLDNSKINYNYNKKSIDDLINSEIKADLNINKYFPNNSDEFYSDSEIETYLSIPFKAVLTMDIIDKVYIEDNINWIPTKEDLNSDGLKLFKMLENLYPNQEIKLLTFIF